MTEARWVPLRTAWREALYGDGGFYRHHRPADHFRTSPQVSASFAAAVVALVRRQGLTSVCDIGSGAGELLTAIHQIDPELTMTAVELRERPEALAKAVEWQREMPAGQTGLVFANELLDNVPCDVVEQGADGRIRVVEVDVVNQKERLGAEPGAATCDWLRTWWPLAHPGQRAEVGRGRDRFWARVCDANPDALVVCVDYGHQLCDRPFGGSLASYRGGVQAPVRFDGLHDITAHVAIDSVAATVGGVARCQRDVLMELGITAARPPMEQAESDPGRYLRELARSSVDAELIATGGLGDFWWVFSREI